MKRELIRYTDSHPHHEAHQRGLKRKTLEPQRVLELHGYFKSHLYIGLTSIDAKTNAEKSSAQVKIAMASARTPMPLFFEDHME